MTNTANFPRTIQMLAELTEIAEARRAANGGEDFTYVSPEKDANGDSSCFYVHGNVADNEASPGCLFGVWLHTYKEVSLEELSRRETTSVRAWLPAYVAVDDLTVVVADLIQGLQDDQVSWGAAIEKGREHFEYRAARG